MINLYTSETVKIVSFLVLELKIVSYYKKHKNVAHSMGLENQSVEKEREFIEA